MDFWGISQGYHRDITGISKAFHSAFTGISQRLKLVSTWISQGYHRDITEISQKEKSEGAEGYRTNITGRKGRRSCGISHRAFTGISEWWKKVSTWISLGYQRDITAGYHRGIAGISQGYHRDFTRISQKEKGEGMADVAYTLFHTCCCYL